MCGEQLTQDVDYTPDDDEDLYLADSHSPSTAINSLRADINEIRQLLSDRLPS